MNLRRATPIPFLSLTLTVSLIFYPISALGAVLEVGPGQVHTTITAALTAAQAGDEIRLYPGTYAEGPLTIDKPLTLTGIKGPILDGQQQHQILNIQADDVTVRGLQLQNSGQSSMRDTAAIRVENAKRCRIEANTLSNSNFGIYLANVTGCQIRGNRINGKAIRETSAGNAIHSWKSSGLQISDNTVSGHRDGFYFEFTRDSRMQRNHSHHNLRYGMHFMFSDGNAYHHNRFEYNGAGVAVMYTRNIEMIGNRFAHNWGPSAYGLLLKDISHSTIRDNVFERNTVAMHLEGSSDLEIRHNTLLHNGWAARVLQNSFDNRFAANNFVGNTFDVASNASDSSQNINAFVGNHWDKYSGYDLDRDGIGDVPHHPVSLFSRLVEHIPPAVMLLRSFLVSTLDVAERVSPVLTPKTMVDPKPRTRRLP